jgi:peptidoglycan hydrolase-like protein with peptidoglycan-binding domain
MNRKMWTGAGILAAILVAGSLSGAEAAPAKGERAAVRKTSPARAEMILQAGTALKKLGFYKGEPSGKWGSEIRGATEAFQKSRGLKVTGRLNQDTRTALGMAEGTGSKSAKGRPADAADNP